MYEKGWIKKSGIRAQIPWNALSTISGTSQLIARTAVRLFQFPKYLLRRMNHILYTRKATDLACPLCRHVDTYLPALMCRRVGQSFEAS